MSPQYADHPYVVLNAHIDELQACYEAIEEAQQQLRKTQQKQHDILNVALRKAYADGDLKSLAQYLYLDAPQGIFRNEVKSFVSHLGQKGGPQWLCEGYTYEMPCCRCGKPFDYVVTSFTDLQEVSKPPPQHEKPYMKVRRERTCQPCQEALDQERDAQAEAYRRKTAQLLRQLRDLDYRDYLKTAHWQSIRASALRRAKFRCQLCNASGNLHVHHRSYEHLGEEQHHMHDVIVLCAPCHAKHHDIAKR